MVEIIRCSLRVSKVVRGDGEDVCPELEFQNDAGAGNLGAGLGELALCIHLSIAGGGESRFQGLEFGEQLRAKDGLMFSRRGDEAVEKSGNLADARTAVFHQALREKFSIGTAAFGEFVADTAFALADGGADELESLVLGDGAARLSGLEGGACGKFRVEGIERGFGGGGECRNVGWRGRQGLELADMIFGELPKFLGADAAVFQVVFKESFDVYHSVTGLSGFCGEAKPHCRKPLQLSRNR